MDNNLKNLRLRQIDKKLKKNNKLLTERPDTGWIKDIRTSLNMSSEQLGKRLNIGAEAVKKMEKRERDDSIRLKTLDEAAKAFGLRLVYGFCAPEDNLEKMTSVAAEKKAKTIVMRTDKTMTLENQANSRSRLRRSIKELAAKIEENKPKYLWD